MSLWQGSDFRNVKVNQVDCCKNRERDLQLKYKWVFFNTDKVAALKNVFEDQNLEKDCAT